MSIQGVNGSGDYGRLPVVASVVAAPLPRSFGEWRRAVSRLVGRAKGIVAQHRGGDVDKAHAGA